MNRERIAERAARAVYGTIIGLAVILALEETGAGANDVTAATVGAVIAAALAELYAQYIGAEIRERRPPAAAEIWAVAIDTAAGTLAALIPVIPFVLAELGALDRESAYDIAPWLGVGVLVAFAALANRFVGLTGGRNAVVTAVALAVALVLIGLKALVH